MSLYDEGVSNGVERINRGLANGPMDRKLLAAAADGLSPREMARVVGDLITPEEAAQRVRTLLSSRTWLTFFEQEQLALESVNEMLTSLRDWTAAGSLDHIKVAFAGIKLKLDQLNKNRISPEVAANIIREGQARIMLSAIQVTMMSAADELGRRYPEVRPEEVRQLMLEALPNAVETVERRLEQS
jgi:hypothetical protein